MKILKTIIGGISILIALWFGWSACSYFAHMTLPSMRSDTTFVVDGVQMTPLRLFIPVTIYLAVAVIAFWFGKWMLNRKANA